MTITIATVVADLDADPRFAGELRYTRAQIKQANGDEAKLNRIWRAFVVALSGGKFASTLARTDPARLEAYRDIFAELGYGRPAAQQELGL